MLVQFSVKNFMSFKERATLDMTVINSYKEHPSHVIDIGKKEKYLKTTAIYGANASGKSNFLEAFQSFKTIIRKSFNTVDPSAKKYVLGEEYIPFLFDDKRENIEFEIIYIQGEFEYQYGFEYNDKQIISEWLYRKKIETNRRVRIFERMNTINISFGPSVKKDVALYAEQVPDDALILSFFGRLKLKTDIFQNVYRSMFFSFFVIDTDSFEEVFDNELQSAVDSPEGKQKLLQFLNAIESGIDDIFYKENNEEIDFYTIHRGRDGKEYHLDLMKESSGTLKSITIFLIARGVIEMDSLLIVDELNTRLHPLLLKFIVDLFYEENSKAQLVYTTHDTTLLDKKFFRRDQIWFVQKNDYGESELIALSDFKVRTDASFEKDYLAGVYGGIPLLKEFSIKVGESYGQ